MKRSPSLHIILVYWSIQLFRYFCLYFYIMTTKILKLQFIFISCVCIISSIYILTFIYVIRNDPVIATKSINWSNKTLCPKIINKSNIVDIITSISKLFLTHPGNNTLTQYTCMLTLSSIQFCTRSPALPISGLPGIYVMVSVQLLNIT